ncbi:MAG: serine/threonine-protein kinase, partial [Terriglobales bacterium]
TPERFRQIRNLFEAALERDAATRSSFLAEACQGDEPLRDEVGRLLTAHEKGAALLDRGAVRPELLTGEAGKMEGRRIDHYEILRELGRGGMGSVYLAVRTDDVYRKPVAFKVVRPEAGNREVIERFRREREILASLDHPNLARLLDGGTTPEGLPYFVMDYVEGQPIDTYCDERQLNIAERLKLFRPVCAAVEYAHGRGVVHRDLKPANVLVTADGVIKLLDFGIAKLLRTDGDEATAYLTRTGMHLMTPEYASPEQVRGEAVGRASDIYALGVILYELLTGHRPYRMRSRLIHEVVRVICEEEPTQPSTAVTEVEQRLAGEDDKPVAVTPQTVSRTRAATPAGLRRQLSGDPDKIILKALRKERAQRYPTAEAFAEDLRRHLDGLPVLAQGESVVYRAGKFLQRYRGWAIAAGVLLAALALGLVKLSGPGTALLLSALTFLPVTYYVLRKLYGH